MISPKKAIWLRTSGSFHACPTRMRRSIAAASPNVGLEARPNDADPMRSDRATLQSVSEEVLRKDQEPPRHGERQSLPWRESFWESSIGHSRTTGSSKTFPILYWRSRLRHEHRLRATRGDGPRSRQTIIGERLCALYSELRFRLNRVIKLFRTAQSRKSWRT